MSSNPISLPGYIESNPKRETPRQHSAWMKPEAGMTLWFTGLSASGKSTLTHSLARELRKADVPTVVLDSNVLRNGFCAGLGYSRKDRNENVRRIADLASRLSQTGAVVLVATIAPYRDMRASARQRIGRFLEVYVNASLETCVERDPRGLYSRAIAGEIPYFTGVNDPYEEPLNPDIECRTDTASIDECTAILLAATMQVRAQYLVAGVDG
jgi:adenylylsulfate kinase